MFPRDGQMISRELPLVFVRIEVSDDYGVVPALDLIKVDHESVGAVTTGHRHRPRAATNVSSRSPPV